MFLSREQLESLQTPCVVLDMDTAQRNIEAMQREIDQTNCRLRPHVKTHKMPLFARMQVAAGAAGITCAKISEAEVMADGGLDDIFIAYPIIGDFRIMRAIALQKKIKRLILAIDSAEGACRLSALAAQANTAFEVRMEIDTGAGRTGIQMDRAAALAKEIAALPNLHLTGIYTFKGLVYQGELTEDNDLAAREEGEMMAAAAAAIRACGIELQDISAGSSPTGVAVAKTGLVNEVRPGTYIFKDQLLCREHVAQPLDIAVRYAATVVSANHEGYAVIDGGTKTFGTDIPLHQPPFCFDGYAAVEHSDDLVLARMNEEHGIVVSRKGHTGLKVGDVLTLIPIHVCTCINQQNEVYLLSGGMLTKERVLARGMTV
ncbi:MAG: alanine racemase [Clostridiales bacterium]|nr:alanine racemase [Clostridiales bacterium]